jgi:5-methylcytosine-specific restriction endonuclease McrBC regulatory subunit McrC
MYYQEENFNSKVRGKIDIKKNIRMNTTHGRNERFYCKYIDFTEDNIENRILKATLIKCKAIVESRFEDDTEFSKQASFCLNAFKHVKLVNIRMSDFRAASVTGLYMYYKPILQQAKSILSQKYFSYKADNGTIIKKSIYTIPYMINMETVFEFYARIVLKETLDINNYYLEKYSSKKFTEQGVFDEHNALDGIHLMPYCIPDIIVRDKKTDQIVIVLDAKYKPNNRSVRSDSIQLLSYVLLTGTDRCGFVFPGTKTTIKQMRGKDNLSLNTPLLNELKYFELILGNIQDKTIIETLVK